MCLGVVCKKYLLVAGAISLQFSGKTKWLFNLFKTLLQFKVPIAEFYTKSFENKSFIVNCPTKIRERYERKVKNIGIIVPI